MSEALSAVCDELAPPPAEGAFGFSARADLRCSTQLNPSMKKIIFILQCAVLTFQVSVMASPASGAESSLPGSSYTLVWWTAPPHTYSVKVSPGEKTPQPRTPRFKTSLCSPSSKCDKMTLMYSNNDAICKPLLKIYQAYWTKQKTKRTYRDSVWWEDSNPELFVKAGFESPTPLQDRLHYYVPTANTMMDNGSAEVYYQLALAPSVEAQTVHLMDLPYRSHGYHTDIYVSQPGKDIPTYGGDKLAFATYFFDFGEPDENQAETLISHEYVFKAHDTYKKFALVYDGEIVPVSLGLSDGIIQRVFQFHGHPIFVARDPEHILAYRILNGSTIDDVCHIAANVAKINP